MTKNTSFSHDIVKSSSNEMTFSPDEIGELRITSYEIAEACGMLHKNVLSAIRRMEPAWVKVIGLPFKQMFKIRELANGGKRKDPYYSMTKDEALFIATKFSDEARAKLIKRWKELEEQSMFPQNYVQALYAFARAKDLEEQHRKKLLEQQPKVEYYDEVLTSESGLTATQVAQDFGKTAIWLNKKLKEHRVIRKTNSSWALCSKYLGKGYADTYTVTFKGKDGTPYSKPNLVWTEKGREFIHNLLGKEFPLVEDKPETESN